MRASLLWKLMLAVPALLFLVSCSGLKSDHAADFYAAATAVSQQIDPAIAQINALVLEYELQKATEFNALLGEKSFQEDFRKIFPPETIRAWHNACAVMEAYARSLDTLASPSSGKSTAATLAELNAAIQAGVQSNVKFDEVAASNIFSSLLELLGNEKFRHDALKVSQKVDPDIQQLVSAMDQTIGNKRRLADIIYRQFLDQLDSKFRQAGPVEKTPLARQFVELQAQRDALEWQLAGLHSSLMALSQAHHAMSHPPANTQPTRQLQRRNP